MDHEIQGKFEREQESKQGSYSKDRPNTWQTLVIGFEATGEDHILRIAGAGINQRVVRGVLIGLVQSYPGKFDKYVNFKVT